MGWSGSMSTSSAINTTITYTPDTTTVGAYTGSSFTAPIRGIYKFTLKGSGGKTNPNNSPFGSSGGQGGTTIGFLALAANATVYVGAGGPGSAAWVGKVSGTTLSAIAKSNIYFIAGAGGGGCSCTDTWNWTGYNCKLDTGGVGGGSSGGAGVSTGGSGHNGGGGTQATGGAGGGGSNGAYGVGGNGSGASATNYTVTAGRGGDGYWGGGGGGAEAFANGGVVGGGGGGGSGYYYADRLFAMGVTYLSSTSQGGGSNADTRGTVAVTYVAAWDGSATTTVGAGTTWEYYPTSGIGDRAYTVHTFTAPVAGLYEFKLKGSTGAPAHSWSSSGTPGAGGSTTGYLVLNRNQTIYLGVGGTSAAAWVASSSGAALKNVTRSNLYFVAGAGGGNGNYGDGGWVSGGSNGGAGGGASGASAGGSGGTQTSGYAQGSGGGGGYSNEWDTSYWGGPGGDGYWGGYGGGGGNGGGGGSGYIHTSSVTYKGTTYTNSTTQGGGASGWGGATGSIVVTYKASADLPIVYNGVTIQKLIYNGTEITSCTYNGTKLF